MLSRLASRIVRPFRRCLREMLASGEFDAAERKAARQLLLNFELCEQVCEEIVRTAKANGIASEIVEAGDGGEGSTAFEKLVEFLRSNWQTIVIQAVFIIIPMLLGDDGEGTPSDESEA